MGNALLKGAAFALIYYLAGQPEWGLRYGGWGYPLAMAALMGSVGGVADRVIVPRLGNLASTALGSVFIFGATYLAGLLWPGVTVSLAGALLVTALGAGYEAASHAVLLRRR